MIRHRRHNMDEARFIATNADMVVLYATVRESAVTLGSVVGMHLPLKMSVLSFRIAICQNVDYIRKG